MPLLGEDMERSSFIILVGVPIVIWISLYLRRETTNGWLFVAAFLSTCASLALLLRGYFEWYWPWIDFISLANVLLNAIVFLFIGQGSSRGRRGRERPE